MSMPMPCLVLPGDPKITFWPKLSLQVGEETLTMDAYLEVRRNGLCYQMFLEIDEGEVPSADSLYRESRLEAPVIRMRTRDILHPDMLDIMRRKVLAKLAALPGAPDPLANRAARRSRWNTRPPGTR